MQPDVDAKYDDAKCWCNELIHSGHVCLFEILTFEEEVKKASELLEFPTEVRYP